MKTDAHKELADLANMVQLYAADHLNHFAAQAAAQLGAGYLAEYARAEDYRNRVVELEHECDQWRDDVAKERARAEAAEAERDRLAARVAELEQGCRDYSTVLSTYRAERDAALLHAAALTTEESTAGPNEIPDREEMLAERVIELESDVTTLRRALTDSLEAAGYTEDPDMDWPRLPGVVAAMRVRVAELEAAAKGVSNAAP